MDRTVPAGALSSRAHHALASLSRAINRATGGKRSETLCARIAARWGADCLFCRVVGWFTEPDHCARELQEQ